MPDMIPAVGAQVQPPNPQQGLNTISSIIGLQQQRQQLQTGQYAQQTAQAGAVVAQQNARENQALAALLQDPTQLVDSEGSPKGDALQRILAVAPTTGAQKAQQLFEAANEKVAFNQSLNNLNESRRTSVGQALIGVASGHGGREDYLEALDQAVEANPGLSRAALTVAANLPAKPHLTGNPVTDAQLQQQHQLALDNYGAQMGRAVNAPNAGLVTPSVQMVQGKKGLVPTNVNPMAAGGAGPVGAPQQQGVSPSIVTTPAGPLARVGPGADITPLSAPSPGINQTTAQVQNTIGMAQDDRGRYGQISQEGTNASTGAALSDQVAQLADQVRTGQYSKYWTDKLAVLRQNDQTITARQMLDKYAAQVKTMATQNASTDAERGQIDAGMPNPETMGVGAVKEAAQYVGGLFRMRADRQAIADRYAQANGNTVGLRATDDAFMQAANPFLYVYKNLPAGTERQQFLISHGINTPQAIQAFKEKLNQVNHYAGQ